MVSKGSNNERDIFISVLPLRSEPEREARLKKICADRPDLLDRVRSLLKASDIHDNFLETSALEIGAEVDGADITEGRGATIGRYRLLERIGEGGMAVVYMAEQAEPIRRTVALKIIKLGMDTRGVVARFEAERQALAMMNHPGIAKVLDGGATEAGRPYFVMELVWGVPITTYCDENRLSTQARLDLFIEVCHAIQHAHQKGVIHRDVKPSNILVTRNDGRPVPKVIDFGIAKAIEERLTDKTMFTRFQTFIGTPAYMSPEQAQVGGLDIDTRSDIYALGVLLYELLTGRTPFKAEDLLETSLDECRRTIREKEPARPSACIAMLRHAEASVAAASRQTEPAHLVHMLRTDLDWIVLKCLEKDRTRRYETASELAADIRRYLDAEPVQARPPSTMYRLRKSVRRNKVVMAIAAVVVCAAILSTWQAIRATQAKQEQVRLHTLAQDALNQEAQQRQRAETERLAAQRGAYNSDMNLVQQALAANNYGRAIDLLNRHRPSPGALDLRHWEWRYFWNQARSDAAFALPRQPSAVTSVAVSPEGAHLAWRTMQGKLRLWDTERQAVLTTVHGLESNVQTFAFSHSGTHLAAAFDDDRRQSRVRIWMTEQPDAMVEFAFAGHVKSLAFSRDDARLWVLAEDMTVHAWDLESQRYDAHFVALQLPRQGPAPVAFSPDHSLVAFADWRRIRLRGLTTGIERTHAESFEGGTASLALSPDGRILAAGPSFAATATHIKLISTSSGREIARLTGHTSWVPGLAFTPDGKRLVSAGADQTIRIWDIAGREEIATLRGHRSEVYCVAMPSDGQTILSGCKDGTLLAWDACDAGPKKRFETLSTPVARLDFFPTRPEMLSVNLDGTVALWDTDTLQQKDTISALGCDIDRVLIASDGRRVYAGTRHGTLRVLSWPTRNVVTTLNEELDSDWHTVPVGLIDNDRILVAIVGRTMVQLLDTSSWQPRAQWPIERTGRRSHFDSALSVDGRLLAVAETHDRIALLDLSTGQTRSIPAYGTWGISDIAFSPDGRLLAASSGEGTIHLWDTDKGELVDVLRGHLIGVHAVAFSPDGQRLVSSSHGNEAVKLWDVTTMHEVGTLAGEGWMARDVGFSPDGTLIAAINAQGQAHFWRAPVVREIADSKMTSPSKQQVTIAGKP